MDSRTSNECESRTDGSIAADETVSEPTDVGRVDMDTGGTAAPPGRHITFRAIRSESISLPYDAEEEAIRERNYRANSSDADRPFTGSGT